MAVSRRAGYNASPYSGFVQTPLGAPACPEQISNQELPPIVEAAIPDDAGLRPGPPLPGAPCNRTAAAP